MNTGRGKAKIAFGKITLAAPVPIERDEEEEQVEDPKKERGGFGSFSAFKPPTLPSNDEKLTEEELVMQSMMGFSSFGTVKKLPEKAAKTFDVKEMVDAIKKANKQKKAETDETIDTFIVPVVKVNEKVKEKKKAVPGEEEEEDDDDVIGPMPPPVPPPSTETKTKKSAKDGDSDSSSEEEEEADDNDEDNVDEGEDADSDTEAQKSFPLEYKYDVEHGTRPVAALAVDYTATRFATGSLDYEVKLWDFTGLRNRHAFRTTKPCENHPIKHVSFSSNGEAVLVISGSAQAKVLNRDGSEMLECIKGDQYIVDMARTIGHTSALTGGMFNPKNKSEFMTSSDDSTVRLWDVSNSRAHKTIVKLKNAGGLKNRVTACTYSRDGVCFLGAGIDGTFCMWDTRRALVLPTATIKNAHQKNTDIFYVGYSNSGQQVASRGEDGVVNIYDVRNWKVPIYKSQLGEYPAKYFTTDLSFSPDDRHLLISSLPLGTTGKTKDEAINYSTIKFFSTKKLTVVKEHVFDNQIVIRTAWPYKINQILVTFARGGVGILYDTKKSQRGALLAHGKGPKKQKMMGVVEDMTGKVIITPNSLPLYKTERSKNPKREEAKMRADPVKSRRPDLPITAGSGGRVAASGSTLSSYVIRNLGMSKSVKDDMDPREAILRYAKDAEENPIWVTPAYKKTQPNAIFEKQPEEKEPDAKKPRLL